MYDVAGLRIVSLDTSVPGWHHGELTDDQLAWLRDVLATPAEHGTILALHHPPIPSPMVPAAEIIELLDTERLAEVLARHRRPRRSSAGTTTSPSHSTFAGIPVSVAAATCYTADPAPLDRFDLRRRRAPGRQRRARLRRPRRAHSIVPVPGAPEVDGFGTDVAPLLEALSPEERLRHGVAQGLPA